LKKDVVFAKTQKGDNIYVIPTDDLRIKFVVIPLESNLKESILEKVQTSIVNIAEDENSDKTELMIPSFSMDVTNQDVCVGMQTSDGKYVKKGSSKVSFEFAAGSAPHKHFVSEITSKTLIIKTDFIIGKFMCTLILL
jgi:hypothetical protein